MQGEYSSKAKMPSVSFAPMAFSPQQAQRVVMSSISRQSVVTPEGMVSRGFEGKSVSSASYKPFDKVWFVRHPLCTCICISLFTDCVFFLHIIDDTIETICFRYQLSNLNLFGVNWQYNRHIMSRVPYDTGKEFRRGIMTRIPRGVEVFIIWPPQRTRMKYPAFWAL